MAGMINRERFEKLLKELDDAVSTNRVHAALQRDILLHHMFVRKHETPEWNLSLIDQYLGKLEQLGKQNPVTPSDGPGVAFVFQSSNVMAHTEVVLKLGENLPDWAPFPIAICITAASRKFRERMNAAGIEVFQCADSTAWDECDLEKAMDKLHAICFREMIGTLVWTGPPVWMPYVFGRRTSTRQVYLSTKWQSAWLESCDCHLTAGPRSATGRMINGHLWKTAHMPLLLPFRAPEPGHREQALRTAPGRPVFGTMARAEKVTFEYLNTVKKILDRCGDGIFLLATTEQDDHIVDWIKRNSMADKVHLVGYLEPNGFVSILDVYLETFPLGASVSQLAMGHGVPVVSMQTDYSPLGQSDPIPGIELCRSVDEYVIKAFKIGTEPEVAKLVTKAQWDYWRDELSKVKQDCHAHWDVILDRRRLSP